MKINAYNPNIYDQQWNPQEYLRQYYSQDFIPDDEEAIQQRLVAFLKHTGRTFARAIDVGCGPTVHMHTSLAPYVGELHLADYLPENLSTIEQWLRDEPDAHNWDINIKYVLELEAESPVSDSAVETRKQLMRQKVTALKRCDVRQAQPLGESAVYDLVLSAYCVDAATNSKDEWRQWMGNLLGLSAEARTVFLVSSSQANHYQVSDLSFPFAPVNDVDIAAAFAAAGFGLSRITIETIPVKDWAEAGFNSIVIAIAEKG